MHAIAGLDAEAVLASGVTGFRNSPAVSAEMLPLVVQVSVDSLFKVFVGIAGVGVVGTLAIFGIQWKGMEKEE